MRHSANILLTFSLLMMPIEVRADTDPHADYKFSFEEVERARQVSELAEAGDPEAQSRLALLYRMGHGVEQNDALAFQWMGRAANAGDPAAQHYLGLFHLSGIGTEVNLESASIWLRRSADLDEADAPMKLASFILQKNPVGLLAAITYSLILSSAQHGVRSADDALGFLRDEQKTTKRDGGALREAARSGVRDAQYQLGVALADGLVASTEPNEANHWLLRAAEQGEARAMRRLGIAGLAGATDPSDLAGAYQWFWLAKRHGDSMARQDVRLLDQLLRGTAREHARHQALEWERTQKLKPAAYELSSP